MQKKILITGATGFAGSHLAELLTGDLNNIVYGTHVSDSNLANISHLGKKLILKKVDLLDARATQQIFAEVRPDVVYHLAASAFAADSFKNPTGFLTNNAVSQINVLEALRQANLLATRVLIVSSAHIYGLITPADLPIDETVPFRPENPYSVSKITQDYLGLQYFLAYTMPIIRVRPFNHIGVRLSPQISVSRFAKLIAEIEKGTREPVLTVGNMDAKRDFTDVRDMVQAYRLAIEKGIPGEAYNIGSGVSYTMQYVLDQLCSLSTTAIKIEPDSKLFRPSDIPELRANSAKFQKQTQWQPKIALEQTLQDILDYWRKIV